MARRSPPVVNQKYETGCTWRMFRIFSFLEDHSNRRLVSSRKHLNTNATGNGNLRSSSDVLSSVDEKYPQTGVSSRRRRHYSCKSISCVENDQVADRGNEVTKMIVDQRFVNKNYQGKDGSSCQPSQLSDALQILYSNKELFLKLLKEPNSLLVKQIHDLPSSQVKEPYQARQNRMTRLNKFENSNARQLNKFENSNARQCGKPFKSFDRYDSSSSCKPQSSNRIVVLKYGTIHVKNFADTNFGCPRSSPSNFSYNVQNIKPSHFPFGRIKRKLRYVMKLRRKKQQWRPTNGMPYKYNCGCQGLEDGKKVKELEIDRRNSLTDVHNSTVKWLNSSLDLKKRHKIIKVKDSELCTGQEEAASFGENCSRNTNNTSVNIHVEGRKSLSEMINCGIEECKQCTNTLGRTVPLPDFESLPSLQQCEHSSITEGMKHDNNNQMVLRTKLQLQKERENGSFSSLGQKINDSPGAIVKTPSDNLQLFGSDISIRRSLPGHNLHAHHDIPRDGGYKDSPAQNIDINNTAGGLGSFLDPHPEIQILSFSPEVASSSHSPSQRIEGNVNMRNRVEHPSTESVVELFNGEYVTNPPITIFKPDDESPVQVVSDELEENPFAELIKSSMDPINNLTSSKDILDNVREILQAFSLKWDELFMKCESSDQMLDPSIFDELKGLTGQLSGDVILRDCVIETFMELYKNCGFPFHISTKSPNVQAYVVEKLLVKEFTELINLHCLPHPSPITLQQLAERDLARRGSWLNIQVDIEDIAIEVEEDVVEKLVLEIVFEMDIRSTLLGE